MSITRRIREALRPDTTQTRAARYLAEATSIADLEGRQREIDRGRFRARAFPR